MKAIKLSEFRYVLFADGLFRKWEDQGIDQARRHAFLEVLLIIARNAKAELSQEQIRSEIMDHCRSRIWNRQEHEQTLDWIDWSYWVMGFENLRSIEQLEKRLEVLKNADTL